MHNREAGVRSTTRGSPVGRCWTNLTERSPKLGNSRPQPTEPSLWRRKQHRDRALSPPCGVFAP